MNEFFFVSAKKQKLKKMGNSFIKHLLETASTDGNIEEFVNFCIAVHEKTVCNKEECNIGLLVKDLTTSSKKVRNEKKFNL